MPIWLRFPIFAAVGTTLLSCSQQEQVVDLSNYLKKDGLLDLREVSSKSEIICLSSNIDGGVDSLGVDELPYFGELKVHEMPPTDLHSILVLFHSKNKPLKWVKGRVNHANNRNVVTTYARKKPEGFSQCAENSRAVATCVEISGEDSGCIFLFESQNK